MDPDRTTTIGEGEFVATERPFHIMKAVERTRPKVRSWERSWRGFMAPRPRLCRIADMADVEEGEGSGEDQKESVAGEVSLGEIESRAVGSGWL